jgi:very-short-patch-repair endonuclease
MAKGKGYAYDELGRAFSAWKAFDKFVYIMRELHPELMASAELEHKFDPRRNWRFDFSWPTVKVAIEIDGFGWGHQSQKGMSQDNEKANRGVELGWRIFRYNSRDLGSIESIRKAVEQVSEFIVFPEDIILTTRMK